MLRQSCQVNKLQKIMLQHFTNATKLQMSSISTESPESPESPGRMKSFSIFLPFQLFRTFSIHLRWAKDGFQSMRQTQTPIGRLHWMHGSLMVCSMCLAWMFVNTTALPGQDAKASVCPPVYHAGKKRWVWQKIVTLSYLVIDVIVDFRKVCIECPNGAIRSGRIHCGILHWTPSLATAKAWRGKVAKWSFLSILAKLNHVVSIFIFIPSVTLEGIVQFRSKCRSLRISFDQWRVVSLVSMWAA